MRRFFPRKRLFIKIYLTLLASLAIVALASALFFVALKDDDETGWTNRRDRFIEAMLPAEADRATLQATLDKFADALDAELALYGGDGRLLASAGALFPETLPSRRRLRGRDDDYDDDHAMVARLPDGRTVVARMGRPFGPGGANPVVFLVMIAGVIGIAAYPVVRHLTRRLERLRRGVDAWGEGALVTRVPDKGSDEIAAVARSFNRAADHIERMVAAHRALLANASHELRSPLARLRMAIDLYEQAPDDARKREIVRNLGELDEIVEEILLASRLDHVDRLDHLEPVDLLALATEEGARNDVVVAGAPVTIMGDARLLSRMVRNLVQNALRHGAPPVSVDIEVADGTIRIAVRDHGDGIPESEGRRVFEPFYRPSGRSERAGGWGIGLSLVRQIAGHHGGTVHYESPRDGGARFVVELPVGEDRPSRA